MGKIYYIMGKSSSGKDTIYKKLVEDTSLQLKTIIPYTTRPIREGEKNGVEYFFTDNQGLEKFKQLGKLIEVRSYNTFHGIWNYFTVHDGQIDLKKDNYVMIGTLESYVKTKEYFGASGLVPILIELDDGIRLTRALEREKSQKNPRYQEMCRRYLADDVDFGPENIKMAGIKKSFNNDNLDCCFKEIVEYIQNETLAIGLL